MADPRFFDNHGPFALGGLIERIGARLGPGADPDLILHDVAPLDGAEPGTLTYAHGVAQRPRLAACRASACIVAEADLDRVPSGVAALVAAEPRRAFALAAQVFHPRPPSTGIVHASAVIDPTARLHAGVEVGPLAHVGPGAEIGPGTVLGPGVIVGRGVTIGRDCWMGPQVSLSHCHVGDRVTLHAGARIGQDGFGVVPGPSGFTKVPQLGRVIIQDLVEIGANTCVDRGTGGDTVIGEGTCIDNLVQIGHNVSIGRYCVIAALAGISGSVTIGDFVAIGGQSGFADHVVVGAGAEVGAQTGIMRDVPPRARMLGTPAQPAREFFRSVAALAKLTRGDKGP